MPKKKVKSKKIAPKFEKTYGGFTQFQLAVIIAVFVVFMIFFLL